VLSDSQQYQYDVLRTVGGKLISNRQGWFREHSPTHRERVFGLNATAMWSLVGHGLVEAIGEFTEAMTFATTQRAKKIEGPRYERVGKLVREKWSGMCPAGKHGLDYKGQMCDLCPREAKGS
jgi:hypothetical protein